jgi:hypothetical protein
VRCAVISALTTEMVELLAYLAANGFSNYIASGRVIPGV